MAALGWLQKMLKYTAEVNRFTAFGIWHFGIISLFMTTLQIGKFSLLPFLYQPGYKLVIQYGICVEVLMTRNRVHCLGESVLYIH